jgi:ABC-type Na+ efflux pump permease subunit
LLEPGTYISTAIVLNVLLKLWFVFEAGRQLAEDRQQGTLELILSTPLPVTEIVRGQWLALKRQFLGPVIVTLVVFLLFLGAMVSSADFDDADHRFFLWFWSAAMIMLLCDLVAMHWMGGWLALTARSLTRAVAGNMWRILLLPWLGLAGAVLLIVLADTFFLTLNPFNPEPGFFVTLWVLFGLTVDIGYGLWARHKWLSRFRVAATERFNAPRPLEKTTVARGAQST